MVSDDDASASSDTNDDVLSREVAVNASLDANGVTLKAKSRLVAAIDRLAGSLFDWPASVIEGRAAKRRLKDQIERDLLAVQGRMAGEQLQKALTAESALLEAQREEVRRQVNKLGVAIEAVEAIKALPPPKTSQFVDNAGQSQSSGDDDETATVDQDWMNSFARFSEDASSEELQVIWGRVLAGEVRQPGTFSKRTLRFVSELDQQTAQDCEDFARHVVVDFAFNRESWASGSEMNLLLRLQELGLISGVGGLLSKTVTIDGNGLAGLFGAKFGLMIHGTPGVKKEVSAVIVTRLGTEVFSLLLPADEQAALTEIANSLNKDSLKRVEVGEVIRFGGDRAGLQNARIVWSDSPTFDITGGFPGR